MKRVSTRAEISSTISQTGLEISCNRIQISVRAEICTPLAFWMYAPHHLLLNVRTTPLAFECTHHTTCLWMYAPHHLLLNVRTTPLAFECTTCANLRTSCVLNVKRLPSNFPVKHCTRAEIRHVIATKFQLGGRTETSARAEIRHVMSVFGPQISSFHLNVLELINN